MNNLTINRIDSLTMSPATAWLLGECMQARGQQEMWIGRQAGKNDVGAWWNFFLSILRKGYGEFSQKVENASARSAKSDLLRRAILDQVGPFALAEILAVVPAASRQLIKKILQAMKLQGAVKLTGRGRGAIWEVTRKKI